MRAWLVSSSVVAVVLAVTPGLALARQAGATALPTASERSTVLAQVPEPDPAPVPPPPPPPPQNPHHHRRRHNHRLNLHHHRPRPRSRRGDSPRRTAANPPSPNYAIPGQTRRSRRLKKPPAKATPGGADRDQVKRDAVVGAIAVTGVDGWRVRSGAVTANAGDPPLQPPGSACRRGARAAPLRVRSR